MSPVRLTLPLLAFAVGCFADHPPAPPVAGTDDGSTAATTDASASTGAPTTGEPCSPDMPDKSWYLDQDDDGWGAGEPTQSCEPLIGWVDRGGDCDDFKPGRNPGADELCNGVDDDCDGLRDEYSPLNATCGSCGLGELAGAPFWFCEADNIDWLKARESCQAFGEGVDLASVRSAEEDQWIAAVLGMLAFDVAPETTLWLGLRRTDEVIASCDVTPKAWMWTDGAPFEYADWAAGQPDNFPTQGGCDPQCSFDALNDADCPRENCLDWAGDGGWNDVSCHLPGQGFICRGPAPGDM